MHLRRWIVLVVAAGSGAAALLYQMVWMRWFQVLFGSTAYAASATLCAFFAGLAIGSEFFGRRSSRIGRPLVAYAAIEALAALLALAVPFVFAFYDALYPTLYENLSQFPSLFVVVKFVLAMIVMLPPSILLGGSFPLLASAYVRDVDSLGRVGTRLYAVNTLGAAAGSAAGALWLPDWIGVHATYGVAIAISLAAAGIALASSRGRTQSEEPLEIPTDRDFERVPEPPPAMRLRVIAFASGFGTLALEVLLIQAIAQRLDHSVYSFGAVLVVVLLCLAAGAEIVSLTTRWIAAERLLGLALVGTSLLLLWLPGAIDRYQVVSQASGLMRGLDAALRLGGPPLLLGSLVLPLLFRMASGESGGVGRQVGGLLAVNTLGGILGSLLASFFLLEQFGLGPSIALVGFGYGLTAIATAVEFRGVMLRGLVIMGSGAALLASSINPWTMSRVVLEAGDRLVDLREGPYGVVSVVDRGSVRLMKINNHYTLSGAGPRDRLKERAAHIPLLLHPDPQRVLFVGSATGHTAGAAVLHPVREIVLVEIVPEVQELAAKHFSNSNRDVYRDPRTRRVVEDGRNHLRASDEMYDVIVADLFSPWRPGVGSLYTREHFEAVRARLAKGGVFCQWLPLYQHRVETFGTVAATFLDVFPEAQVFRGDFYQSMPRVALIGFEGNPEPVDLVNRRVREFARRDAMDRWVIYPRLFWMLYMGPLSSLSAVLLEQPINSDVHPRFEYLAGRTETSQTHELLNRIWPEWGRQLLAGIAADLHYREALPAARDGLDLARLNALERASNRSLHLSEIRALRRRLRPELVDVPDPSVLESWDR